MKKVILSICFAILLQGCSAKTNESELVNIEYNKQIQFLEEKIDYLEKRIEAFEEANDKFPILSNLSLEFVRAHTTGDIDKLKLLVSDDITLLEKDNKIYKVCDGEITYTLYDESTQTNYLDMVVQGYGYDQQNDTYLIHIAEFYEGDLVGGFFLNLTYKRFNDGWKVVDFEFDI